MYVASAQHCDAKDAKYLLPMTILTGVTTIIGFAVASPLAEKHPRKLSLFASVRALQERSHPATPRGHPRNTASFFRT